MKQRFLDRLLHFMKNRLGREIAVLDLRMPLVTADIQALHPFNTANPRR